MNQFPKSVLKAAREHARAEYPNESCGLVIAGAYHACRNIASDPKSDFVIDPSQRVLLTQKHGDIEAVIHSHPNGPVHPSRADMLGQIETGVPWGIVPLDEDRISDPFFWGGNTPIAPILGRKFQHGIFDCFSVMRDVFRLGREKLKEQDIDWSFDPIELPDVARDAEWWDKGYDLYRDGFRDMGFREVKPEEDKKPGDVFLVRINSKTINHGGLLLSNSLILHHLPFRLSRREPIGVWFHGAEMWIRHEAADA